MSMPTALKERRQRLARKVFDLARSEFGDILLPWEARSEKDARVRLSYEIADKMLAEISSLVKDDLASRALEFATAAHSSIDQRRKYTLEPYIVHPIAVAEIVKTVPHTPEMIAAALLHDTVEDTPVTIDQVETELGPAVADLVGWLTDVSTPADGNRATRKHKDLLHISDAPPAAKTIKLADLIDNTLTIKERDPDFWRVYRHEKMRLLEVLKEGDPTLWKRAWEQCS